MYKTLLEDAMKMIKSLNEELNQRVEFEEKLMQMIAQQEEEIKNLKNEIEGKSRLKEKLNMALDKSNCLIQ